MSEEEQQLRGGFGGSVEEELKGRERGGCFKAYMISRLYLKRGSRARFRMSRGRLRSVFFFPHQILMLCMS